jgi:hypothetical protein
MSVVVVISCGCLSCSAFITNNAINADNADNADNANNANNADNALIGLMDGGQLIALGRRSAFAQGFSATESPGRFFDMGWKG